MAEVLSCNGVVALIVDEIARVNAVVVEGISHHEAANRSVLNVVGGRYFEPRRATVFDCWHCAQ